MRSICSGRQIHGLELVSNSCGSLTDAAVQGHSLFVLVIMRRVDKLAPNGS